MDWKSKWATQLASLEIWFGLGLEADWQREAVAPRKAKRKQVFFMVWDLRVECVKESIFCLTLFGSEKLRLRQQYGLEDDFFGQRSKFQYFYE